ncbi:RNA-directed DNA polymerase, eukaryota, reverse transcriptase zinc-binding domain protein [Tanacetum coccineum]
MKVPLKNLAWKNGNLFQHVKKLEEDLKKAQEEVEANPSNAEIKKGMSNILQGQRCHFGNGDDKAPGPDGFTTTFFKKSWDIVRIDMCKAIKDFFKTNKLLGEVNTTLITLVPKIQHPSRVSEYRPIACCNVVYKCISKIISSRIQGCLDKLISINQSAFVPGRLIQDNLLITQELLKGYNRKKGSQRCALKIDIAKAYDTVQFRRTSLTGFPAQSIRSSNVIALDSPYLLVLITGTSQSRQHESRKSPTKSLFDVGSRRISIVTVNTKEYHSDVLAIITRIMRRTY